MSVRVRVIPPVVTGEDLKAMDRGESGIGRPEAFCNACWKWGHTKAECTKPKRAKRAQVRRCSLCGESGHRRETCERAK